MTPYSLNRCNSYIDRTAYNNYTLSTALQARAIMASPFISDEFEPEGPGAPMAPPPLDEAEYETEAELLLAVNNFTKHQGYAVCISDSQKNAKGVKDKLIISCSRGRKQEPSQSTGKRPGAGSVRVNCPFRAFARLNDNGLWVLNKVKTAEHNHAGGGEGSHVKIRQAFMTGEVKEDIRGQYYSNQEPAKILDFVRKKYRLDSNNAILGPQDVYNYLSTLKLGPPSSSHRSIAGASTLHSHNSMPN